MVAQWRVGESVGRDGVRERAVLRVLAQGQDNRRHQGQLPQRVRRASSESDAHEHLSQGGEQNVQP